MAIYIDLGRQIHSSPPPPLAMLASHAGVLRRVVREGGNTTTLKTPPWEARLNLARLCLDLLEFGTALIQTPNCSCAQTVTTVKYINYFNPFAPEPPVTARAYPGPFYPL